jgi:hypothetical protein
MQPVLAKPPGEKRALLLYQRQYTTRIFFRQPGDSKFYRQLVFSAALKADMGRLMAVA